MGIYLTKKSKDFHDYVRRSVNSTKIRELSPYELSLFADLECIRRSMNHCMTELIFLREVVKKVGIKELQVVGNNISTVIMSLHRQREFLCAVKKAFSSVKPNDEELDGVKKLVSDINKRIDFVNSTVVTGNVFLTPIYDYLSLVGEDNFSKEVKRLFPTYRDIYESTSNGKMDEYVLYVLDILKKHNLDSAYKGRLSDYVDMTSRKKEEARQERREMLQQKKIDESKNGMLIFMDCFFKAVRNLESCSKIGMTESGIKKCLNKGHRGDFIILCCYMFRNSFKFGYACNGSINKAFGDSISYYKTMDDAKKAMEILSESNPGKVFEIVSI